MKKYRTGSVFQDILCILLLRLKLITKDAITISALVSSILIFSIVIHGLSSSAEEQSALPIGIVDYDNSSESRALLTRLNKVPAIRLVESEESKLQKLLLDEMVNAIFIIEEGYEKKLKKGRPQEVITVYYVDSDRASSIISDIVAGEMLYPISLYKSIRTYEGLDYGREKLSATEYEAYISNLLEGSTDFDFAFRMIYANPDRSITEEKPLSNSIIFNQIIFGILGILVSFIAMFLISGVVRDREMGVAARLKISKFHSLKLDTGNYGSVLLVESMIAVLFSELIYRQLGMGEYRLYLSACLLILLYAMLMGGIFLLIAKVVKSIIAYQMLCTILILIMGGLGFYRLLSGLSEILSESILKIIPNNWFIQGFTDIIVYGNNEGILTQGHRMLIILTGTVLFLMYATDLILGKTGISLKKEVSEGSGQ